MKIHILYDPRKDRALLEAELKRQGLTAKDYVLWTPIQAKTSPESINRSHKMIVKHLAANGDPYGIILEDDVMFPSEFGFKVFRHTASGMSGIDILLGGAYCCAMPPPEDKPLGDFRGLHCYAIYQKYYDIFLDLPAKIHIDQLVSDTADVRVVYPFIALQRPGISANTRAWADYNTMLKPEDIFTAGSKTFSTV